MKSIKELVFITLCALGLFGCGQKRPAVINRPVFEDSNTSTIEIDKIEMSDSATVFHIVASLSPGRWIAIDKNTYIKESGSDEKLFFTHGEGINLDDRNIIP